VGELHVSANAGRPLPRTKGHAASAEVPLEADSLEKSFVQAFAPGTFSMYYTNLSKP
jgi:hypothetical protein